MDKLKALLKKLSKPIATQCGLTDEALHGLFSVYPFNEFEYVISHLLAQRFVSLDEYLQLRNDYLMRNKYLHLYEITAPRTFGETWAQNHIGELVQELQRPTRELDADYTGQYDFWYNGIRIEVKASRAVQKKSGGALISKALCTDSPHKFDMNFQQIKPACCDVFVWIGVWRNEIRYWVLSSKDVADNDHYSKGQHRGNTGEGQLWVKDTNIAAFEAFRTAPRDLLMRICACAVLPKKG